MTRCESARTRLEEEAEGMYAALTEVQKRDFQRAIEGMIDVPKYTDTIGASLLTVLCGLALKGLRKGDPSLN